MCTKDDNEATLESWYDRGFSDGEYKFFSPPYWGRDDTSQYIYDEYWHGYADGLESIR